ncbi:MAG: hypothetical protein K6G61_04760 [Solobacterium sp.]|nr:hypothetical protein [Solobacterium sp.]
MKYSINTYRLYQSEKMFSHTVRIHVRMKDEADRAVLDQAVNTAMKRYPYFAVRVSLDEEGGYVLLPNDARVVVLPTGKKLPKLGSKAVNGHLVYADCEGKDIYLNISHSLCGGKGFQPWVMTTVYEYVKEKYNADPDSPGIRKPDSALLPTETAEPSMGMLTEEEPVFRRKDGKSPILAADYLNGLMNPFMRKPNYRVFVIDQAELIKVARQNDASVMALFFIIFARVLDRFFAKKYKTITGECAHNPRESLGLPDTHCDIMSHIHVGFDRDMLDRDLETLGTMTRGQIILQSDPSVSHAELRNLYSLYDAADQEHGIKNKRKYIAEHSHSTGHGSFVLNYTGQMDWGEVADYIDWYAYIIEGHFTIEITALADKIIVGFMQLVDTDKYARAFREELARIGLSCKEEGPYPKRLPKHDLPQG